VNVDDLDAGVTRVLGRSLSGPALADLHKYIRLLIKWQGVTRLVGSEREDWIVEHIVLDSLLFAKVLPVGVRSVLDLGSGAGVPGIPLAIAMPDLQFTLVESRRKRASFLSQVKRDVGLTGVRIFRERLMQESIPVDMAKAFDAIVMRCAGDLSTVIGLGMALVRTGGSIVATGPPEMFDLPQGRWVTVEGTRPKTLRRFAVIKG
jgi:16S rRNA (guanine527-N7)-methyltransferase